MKACALILSVTEFVDSLGVRVSEEGEPREEVRVGDGGRFEDILLDVVDGLASRGVVMAVFHT